jgi:hypothetical protein
MIRRSAAIRRGDGEPGETDRFLNSAANSHAWLLSLIVHLSLLILFGLITIYPDPIPATLRLLASPSEEPAEPNLAREFFFAEAPTAEIGAGSLAGLDMAMAAAPELDEISAIPKLEQAESYVGEFMYNDPTDLATSPILNREIVAHGEVGIGETGAEGAIDRITHEILLSLEERPTLVVWLFDQSGSLLRQREMIRKRFDRIYEELGIVQQSGSQVFAKHAEERPLLSSIMAFGQHVSFRTKKPTDNLQLIKQLVAEIPLDDSGIERVFSAVEMAADQFKVLRKRNRETGEPSRNVMLVVVTDEAGDDPERMDSAVELCRNFAIPVYVVGVPAPFGRRETLVKWVDPNPDYDQTPQWASVNQGPESLLPERLRLGRAEGEASLDSGFGPYGLTRLAYESGGVYFAVHPQRDSRKRVRRRETSAYAAHIEYFFDPAVMRRYQPGYVSVAEYRQQLKGRPMRHALVSAAQMSWLEEMETPRRRFVKRDDAEFVRSLSEAQKAAAKLEPKVNALFNVMQRGESDRPNEQSLRWRAGFDLAMGQIMAARVRTESYNALLAMAKRGMKFRNEQNNTWVLMPANRVSIGSKLENIAAKSREYLQRVVREHPETPWAMLAQQELATPITWKWSDEFTDLNPRPRPRGNANNRPPRDDRARSLPRKPKRPVPKL